MLDNAQILSFEFGKSWINKLSSMTNDEIQIFCNQKNGNQELITRLQQKLLRLDGMDNARHSLPKNYIRDILLSLVSGNHVVIDFGYKPNILCYQLLVNMICRRVYSYYGIRTEKSLNKHYTNYTLPKLVITIEDAHYFLNSNEVRSNIFQPLIRKSWKSYITLLAIERHPSKIDPEILSEFYTLITGFLNEEDKNHILSGFPIHQELYSMLSQINLSQNMLFFGYGIKNPEVVHIREYDNYVLHT
ncbi:MAG: hypothetical protein RLZZ507_3419 [Cyanobacteriota bacterium]|jgi:hypothetical protein